MSHEDMKKWWTERRQNELAKGLQIVLNSKLGENEPRVVNLRRMVDMIDHSVAQSEVIHCTVGVTAKGEQVGDITPAAYMCHKWKGMEGSSIARIDGKVDKLPEELMWDLDGGKPTTVSQLMESSPDSLIKKPVN
jgi:hypothetical protein